MDEHHDLPIETLQLIVDDLVKSGYCEKAVCWFRGADSVSPFLNPEIAVAVSPARMSGHVARKIHYVTAMPTHPVMDGAEAGRFLSRPCSSEPFDTDMIRMASGGVWLPSLLFSHEAISSVTSRKDAPDALVVSVNDYDVGKIVFDGGLEFVSFSDCTGNFRLVSATDLSIHENLIFWLRGFLPLQGIIDGLCARMGDLIPDIKSEAGLFAFFRDFGEILPGGIRIRKPLSDRCADSGRAFTRINTDIERKMPYFSHSLGFPLAIFPGQSLGFPLDCEHGFFNGGMRGSHYFIPEQSYGESELDRRIRNIVIGRANGIPTVDYRYVREGRMRGLALRRFDLLGGLPVWRENLSQIPEGERREVLSMLPELDRIHLYKRISLGIDNIDDCVLVQYLPDMYPANGPDVDRELFLSVEKPQLRLAAYAGSKQPQTIVTDKEKNRLKEFLALTHLDLA